MIIRDTLFPPRIICDFGGGQVGSRLNWPIILGPAALALYVIFWVRFYRFVDREFRNARSQRS